MEGHGRVDVPPTTQQMWEEYRYCKDIKPGLTHEQFLEEPAQVVKWLLEIDDVVAEVTRSQG